MGILTNAKHITGDVDGVRCSIVESAVTKERAQFLIELLKFNGYEVRIQENAPIEGSTETLYIIGVTDILFNAVYRIYELLLKRPDGKVATPAFWRQEKGDTTGWYWTYGKSAETDYYE
jgi:hypothetical protein